MLNGHAKKLSLGYKIARNDRKESDKTGHPAKHILWYNVSLVFLFKHDQFILQNKTSFSL